MAIQVGGTTVIDDSRNLSNVGGLKTVGGNSILGSGDIATGGSTTAGDVGTYALLMEWDFYGTNNLNFGDTLAGSSLRRAGLSTYSTYVWGNKNIAVSGTWRLMGDYPLHSYQRQYVTNVWVRIS